MANKKGFKAVVLESLSDEQLESMVLSNWHKLNTALKAGQSMPVLRRLLMLELMKGSGARQVIAERIRSSLSRAIAQRSKRGLDDVLEILAFRFQDENNRTLFFVAAIDAGLEIDEVDIIWKRIGESM